MITAQNKTKTATGASTLKPEVINRLLGDNLEGEKSMAEWLASLNKQEEGESQFTYFRNELGGNDRDKLEAEQELKGQKIRSGMLDKAVTNIRRKEVWPQLKPR